MARLNKASLAVASVTSSDTVPMKLNDTVLSIGPNRRTVGVAILEASIWEALRDRSRWDSWSLGRRDLANLVRNLPCTRNNPSLAWLRR
jgi:hypothetical protein